MSAIKLIVTDKQKEDIVKFVNEGLTGAKIAKEFGVSQATMWRVMEDMGLNNKQKKPKQEEAHIFNWKMFNGTVI